MTDYIDLPEITPNSDPSWFGFLITLKMGGFAKRAEITEFLEEKKIGTRLLFAGNLTKQPAYLGENYIIHSNLDNTDFIMNNSFWVGVWPGLERKHLDYIIETLTSFFNHK